MMRLVAGGALISHGFMRLLTGQSLVLEGLGVAAGLLLLAGLWTPIAGWVVAVLGIWSAIAEPGDPRAGIFLGTIGLALALLGPGQWSIDARLFGWKRINLRR